MQSQVTEKLETGFDAPQRGDLREQVRAEDRLRIALDSIPALLHTAEPDGSLDYFNQRWLDYLGGSLDDVRGWGWTTKIHPDDVDSFVKEWQNSLRTAEPFEAEARVRRHDGVYRWMLHRKAPLRDEQGKVIKWYGSSIDIDDLKRNEFYLAEGQRLSHVGSWAFNPAGFEHWSPELFGIHGLDPSAKAPSLEEYLALVHPEDRESVLQTVRKMFADGCGFDFTKRIVRPDGEIRSVRCVGVPSGHAGTSQSFVGTGIDVTEQERILDELKRSEFYLAEGQRLGHAGSWSFKPDGTCDYWSSELYEILGFEPGAGIPTISDYFTRIHPQDREVVVATIQHMIAAGEGCDLKKRIIRPDGVQRVIRCVGKAIRENGLVTRFVGTLMDITEQEELTRELRRREAYLAEAQRLSHTGSFSLNVVTGERTWSDESYRILGYDRSIKPAFERVRDRVHPDDLEMWEEAVAGASEGKQVDFEPRLLMPDGSVKHLHVVAYGVQQDGKYVEVVGTAMDITERKRAEDTIRRSEAYLAEAQRLSKTGSFAWSPATDNTYYSEECYRVLGFEPQGAAPPPFKTVMLRIHPDDQVRCRERVEKAVRDKVDFELGYRIVHPDKSVRDIHCVSHVVLDRSGELIELVGTVIDVTEQRQARAELEKALAEIKKSEDRLRVIIDTIPTMAWVDRPDGSAEFLSRGWLDYTGLSLEEALNWGWTVVIHSEDSTALMDKWLTSVATGKPFEAEARFRRADGKYRWCLCRGVPLRDETGNIIQWHGTTTDIEDRKRAEEELRTSESKYRHLVDTTPAFIHTASPNGDVDFFNRGWLEYVGRPLTDLLGWGWTCVIHPEDVEANVPKWRSALQAGEPFVAESRVRRADGEYRWFLHREEPLRNEAGEIVKWYGSSIEIEERKIAEEAIRRGEAFLAEGQRLSHTGSWAWNASTGKLTWSQEHFRILGLDPQVTNPSQNVFWERVHPDDRIGLRHTFESAIREKRDFEQEFRIVTSDSSVRHLHGVGHAILNKANELVEFIGSTMDITERKRAEAALQEARAELERVNRVTTIAELAASIAHEINQPLAGVVTSANAGLNWLAANPPNLLKTREALERILRDGTRGGEVLTRIRALLKRTPPARTPVSVNTAVRDVLALVSGELRQHQVELSLELAHNLPAIHGDGIQLQQVILNLIKNAIEAMAGIVKGQRTLRIQSSLGELEGKPAVVVEVSDTGVGFSGADGSRLFEAFHTTKPQGMGMGLWISRSIIESHHGRLTASSNHGPGATFVIMLPKMIQEQA